MSKEMEKLVEELDRLFIEECGNDSLTPYSELDADDRWVVEQAWDKIITLIIGKAYARQDLLLPEEAGRAVWAKQGDEDHIYDWVADTIENGARTFIALREEEND